MEDTRNIPIPGLNGCTALDLQSQNEQTWGYPSRLTLPDVNGWSILWDTYFKQMYRPGFYDDEESYINRDNVTIQVWIRLLSQKYGAENIEYDEAAVVADYNKRQDLAGYGGVYLLAPSAGDSCAVQENDWNPVTKQIEGPPVDQYDDLMPPRRSAYNYTCNGKCKNK